MKSAFVALSVVLGTILCLSAVLSAHGDIVVNEEIISRLDVNDLRRTLTEEEFRSLVEVTTVEVWRGEEMMYRMRPLRRDPAGLVDRVQTPGQLEERENVKFDPAIIWQIGKALWDLIEANRPVVNVSVDYAGAIPAGINDWTQLNSWKDIQTPSYRFKFKNAIGMTASEFVWVWSWKWGGNYQNIGQYVTLAGPSIVKVDAGLGSHVYVSTAASNPINYGTAAAPIGGLDFTVSMKTDTPLGSYYGSCKVTIRGDSQSHKIVCDQN